MTTTLSAPTVRVSPGRRRDFALMTEDSLTFVDVSPAGWFH